MHGSDPFIMPVVRYTWYVLIVAVEPLGADGISPV